MKVRPLTGQVLIEVLAPPTRSIGGVELPDERPLSPDFVQEGHRNPEKPAKNHIGIVRNIGQWPRLPNGMLNLPEFGIGAKVVFNPFRGQQLRLGNKSMRMVQVEDVLAVLS